MKKRWKAILAAGAVGLGLCLLVLTTFVLYVHTDHAQALAKRIIDRRIPGKVEWTRLRFSLFRGNVELQELLVKDVNALDIAGCEQLHLRWSWPDLLTGNLVVRGGLEKPWAHLEPNGDGQLNLAAAFVKPDSESTEASPGPGLNIVVDSFQVTAGSFQYRDRSQPFLAILDGIELLLAGNLAESWADAQMRFSSGQLSLKSGDTRFLPSSLSLRYAENRIDSVHIRLAADTGQAVITGSVVEPLGQRRLKLKGEMSAVLGDMAQLLGLPSVVDGNATLKFNIRGTPENPDLEMELAHGGGNFFDRSIDNLALKIFMSDRAVDIEAFTLAAGLGRLRIAGAVDLRSVFPKGFFDSPPDFEALSYQLRVEQENMALAYLLGPAAGLHGELDAEMVLSGKGIDLATLTGDCTLEAAGREISVAEKIDPTTLRLRSQLALDRGRIMLHDLSAQVGALKIEARAEADLNTSNISGDFRLEAPQLAPTLAPLGVTALNGRARAHGEIAGTFGRPEFVFSFDGTGLAYDQVRFGDVHVDAAMDATGRLHVHQLLLDNRGSVLQAQGDLQLLDDTRQVLTDPSFKLAVTLSDMEAADFIDASQATGHLGGNLELFGTRQAPRARMQLEGRQIGFNNVPVGNISARLEFKNGQLELKKVDVLNAGARLHLTGTAGVLDPETLEPLADPVVELNLAVQDLRLENHLAETAGRVSLDASIAGRLKHPRGPVTVRIRGLQSPWQNLDQLDLTAELEGDSLWVERMALSPAPGQWVLASGRISRESMSDVKISSDGISLAHIGALKENALISGKLKGQLKGSGPFHDLSAQGTLILTEFLAAGKPMADMRADLELANQEIRLDVQHEAADLQVTGHLLQKAISGQGRIHLDDLRPYLAFWGPSEFGGGLHGSFRVDGHFDAPEKLAVSIDLQQGRIDFKGHELLRAESARVTLANGQLQLPTLELRLPGEGRLRLKGAGRMGGALDFEAEGHVPLAVGRAFRKELADLAGDLRVFAAIRGSWDQLDLQGRMDLESAALTLPDSGQKLHGVNATITLTPERITIDELRGRLDEGRFRLSGALALKDWRPGHVDLTLSASDVPLIVPDMLDVSLESRLELSGTPDEATLTGSAAIQNGLYYKDVALNPLDMLQPRERRAVRPEPPEIAWPYLKNLALDVKITSDEPFMVNNNLAELEVVPDIRISGSLQRPRVIGGAAVPGGIIRFHNRRFEVVRGSVDFVRPFVMQPDIHVRGETQIRQWEVYVDVTGPMDDLALTLSSDPTEQPGDILALIVTGRTSEELAAGGDWQRHATAEVLAGLANTPFGGWIRNLPGLDTFESETENTRVTIGTNLSERVSLRYGAEAKRGAIVRKTIAEIKLSEHILMSGFQDNNGIFGNALVFRVEFR